MSEEMRKKLTKIRIRYKKVTQKGFYQLFEQRNIVFVADGTDLNLFEKFQDKRKSMERIKN
tara:strand:- start:466 stop:648 length:183 start_codon:yes stop_codon:yes gene_type:complete